MTARWTGTALLIAVQPDSYKDSFVQRTYSLVSQWRLEPVRVKVRLELLRWATGFSVEFRADDFESDSSVQSEEFPLDFLDSCVSLSTVAPLELSLMLADLRSVLQEHQREGEAVLKSLDFTAPSQHNHDKLVEFAMKCHW